MTLFFGTLLERMDVYEELYGFDLELVGFDCAGEIEWDTPPICPFKPGCGLSLRDCPLKRQQAMIARAPRRVQ